VRTGIPEEGVDQQEIQQAMQRWNVKYEISGRDSKIWRPPKGVEPTRESSAIPRWKRKLDMMKGKSQQKMPRHRG
jgi:hypothetical protein